MSLSGQLIIGFDRVRSETSFRATDPTRGSRIDPAFSIAQTSDVTRACELAEAAFDNYRDCSLEKRARFLELCAQNLMVLGDELLERAGQESGLPRARLEGERARTVG